MTLFLDDATSDRRRLVLMRHAKAESVAESDHARRLVASGVADAAATGRWLAGHGIHPDHVLVSDATRTRETWAAVLDGAGWEVEPAYDDGLYAAGSETALDLIAAAPADARCVMVIGHNPTIAFLAQTLDDGDGDNQAAVEMTMGFPPAAVAVFEIFTPWSQLAEQTALLRAFHAGVRG